MITRQRFSSFCRSSVFAALATVPALAQMAAVMTVNPPEKIAGKRGETVTAQFEMVVKGGYHVNSNTPSDPYLIPLKFTWTDGSAQEVETVFPKPEMAKSDFSPKPISVFTGEFKTHVKFKIQPNAPVGPGFVTGKVRYQACNDRMCLPPRNVELKVPLEVR